MKADEPVTPNTLAALLLEKAEAKTPSGTTPLNYLLQCADQTATLLDTINDCVTTSTVAALTRMVAAYAANNNDADETKTATLEAAQRLSELVAVALLYAGDTPILRNICDATIILDN